MNKTAKRTTECMKAGLKTFDEQNLHKLTHVALCQLLWLTHFTLVVKDRSIASVFEFFSNQFNRLGKDNVFLVIKLIESRLRLFYVLESQFLRSQILGKVFCNLCTSSAYH